MKGSDVVALIAVAGLGLGACAAAKSELAQGETLLAKKVVSDEQENQIGLQLHQELEQKQQPRFVADPAVTGYVERVAQRVLAPAQRDRPGLQWKVVVLDDPDTVNAFATPGGYLYVYTGLLLACDNEAQLAGVLGHEAGHVVAHHAARQIVDEKGIQAVSDLALGKNPGLVAELADKIVTKGALLVHSRADENEADEYGARYAATAGYDPHQLAVFFEKLKTKEGSSPKLLTYLSDHPATPDRIAHVDQYISARHLAGSDEGTERIEPVKERLQALAPGARTM